MSKTSDLENEIDKPAERESAKKYAAKLPQTGDTSSKLSFILLGSAALLMVRAYGQEKECSLKLSGSLFPQEPKEP